MITDAQIDFVLDHPVTRICAGLGELRCATGTSSFRLLTPDQLRRVGRRLWALHDGTNIDWATAIVWQADELANPRAQMSDADVDLVLGHLVMRIACRFGKWRRDAEGLTLDQVRRIANKVEDWGHEQLRAADALERLADTLR